MKQILSNFKNHIFFGTTLLRMKWQSTKARYDAYLESKKDDMLEFLIEKDNPKAIKKFLSLLPPNSPLAQKLSVEDFETGVCHPILLRARSSKTIIELIDFGCPIIHPEYKQLYDKALENKEYEFLKSLIKRQVWSKNINRIYDCLVDAIFFKNNNKEVCFDKNIDLLKFLISQGLNVNNSEKYVFSPFTMLVILTNSIKFREEKEKNQYQKLLASWIDILLKLGSDLFLADFHEENAIEYAVKHKNETFLDIIIDYYSDNKSELLRIKNVILNTPKSTDKQNYLDKISTYIAEEEKDMLEATIFIPPLSSGIMVKEKNTNMTFKI